MWKKYTGALKLKCNDGHEFATRGLGKGSGHGSSRWFDAKYITKVQINAGSYVDRVYFYNQQGSAVSTCGRSGGGSPYVAHARLYFYFFKIFTYGFFLSWWNVFMCIKWTCVHFCLFNILIFLFSRCWMVG